MTTLQERLRYLRGTLWGDDGKTLDEAAERIAALEAALEQARVALESYGKSPYIKHEHPKRFAAGAAALRAIEETRSKT